MRQHRSPRSSGPKALREHMMTCRFTIGHHSLRSINLRPPPDPRPWPLAMASSRTRDSGFGITRERVTGAMEQEVVRRTFCPVTIDGKSSDADPTFSKRRAWPSCVLTAVSKLK